LSRMAVTFVCENRHEVESIMIDLTRRPGLEEDEIWQLLSKNCRCRRCGSTVFTYRVRYKEYFE